MLVLACAGLAGPALGLDRVQLEDRIRTLTAKFAALQQMPDRRVPADQLRKARGIILLDRIKAGFFFAYQGGGGVALVKDGGGRWSPAAFLTAKEASIGFQFGGEQNFSVILLMTTNATQALTGAITNMGGEARGTAGAQSAGVDGRLTSDGQPARVYGERAGLYGGISFKGGTIAPDNRANEIYYGKPVSMSDILFDNKVRPTPADIKLARQLAEFSEK